MSPLLMLALVMLAQAGGQVKLCFRDFYQIMEKSKLTYSIEELKQPVVDTATAPLPISMDSRVKENGDGLEVIEYKRKKEAASLLEELEGYYRKKDNNHVRALCYKILEIDSTDSKVLAYLGETFSKEGDYAAALAWGVKSVMANRNNWFAHMMLGKCYLALADTNRDYRDSCLREYATALVLNRSVAVLEVAYGGICKKFGKKYTAWKFIPQCNIWKEGKKVHIETDTGWMAYAVAKAVRNYEPVYKYEKDKKWPVGSDTNMEEELLMNLANGYAAEIEDTLRPVLAPREGVTDPLVTTLFKAFNQGMVNEYIFYEIWTPKIPLLAHCLPKESFDKLVQYVLTVRTSDGK